ncbi:uncharacterized protein CANTADRAFT_46428 [Suhomyces tanzawaensis NRRL Y-17324]|uniref:Uncharacterized protein n=1 Tax=Suhomyces tanzawaensis NRRL Y-17324 TaxID=984487 RepID=A0A1E4SMD5_9ASCO|nr:uncharacterized protein CANTADRAFT_46428 [Suhomyces tanzawaensis NRRL Y-17324]ODV80673.1 hypothetical protein CANTADRAFT_46428 [Suhomyces tanzawaensis NRRL Y-17324]
MSNEFLHLSPSRNLIDPLIYNGFEDDKKTSGSSKSKTSSSTTSSTSAPANDKDQPSVPPSASKFYGANSTNLTGWTPLISKTYFNEQLMSFNSTPNKHFFSSSANPNMSSHEYVDYSQGLNLTPFLTHNINILNGHPSASSNSISHQLSNITPFHDKTLHLADFLMDSPIRKTPIKDLDTITPSKFRLGSEKKLLKQSFLQDPKSALKRSITQIDTPPRQPHKLSISTKADRSNEDEDEETDDSRKHTASSDDEDVNDKENRVPKSKYYLQTPSKSALSDISNLRKTPIKSTPLKMEKATMVNLSSFQTPAKQVPLSSPSTEIMSSAVRSDSPTRTSRRITEETDDELEEEDKKHNLNHPPSPTPNKDPKTHSKGEPVMGVFSEKKSKLPVKAKMGGPNNAKQMGKSETAIKPKNNKARMQAGMNKFQIVFTDVHALMNNKNKKKDSESASGTTSTSNSNPKLQRFSSSTEVPDVKNAKSKNKLVRSSTAPVPNQSMGSGVTMSYPQVVLTPSSQPGSSHDHSTTINTTKELSIISGNNNSMNTSHLNMSTGQDHSSFELGGLSSTPNGKYFLDKILEKPSPQSQNLLNQANNYFLNQSYGSMLPPHKQQSQQVRSLQNSSNQHPMMMMMSTPQHQNVINYSPNVYTSEVSPSNGEANESNNQLNQHPFGYSKDVNNSSQNYCMVNMHGQSVMMPIMMNSKSDPQFSGAGSSGNEEIMKPDDLI